MALAVRVTRATSRVRVESDARWMRAYFRALDAGIDAMEIGGGSGYAVESATSSSVVYLVDAAGITCTCQAGQAGDPVCLHRAVVRFFGGNLPGYDGPAGAGVERLAA